MVGIHKRRDDAGGHYTTERRTLPKGPMMQKEDIITKREDAEGREL